MSEDEDEKRRARFEASEEHDERPKSRMRHYCNDRTCGGLDCLTCYPGNRDIDLEEPEEIEKCPKCGSADISKRHADTPNCVGIETDWKQCDDCDHQWDHQ